MVLYFSEDSCMFQRRIGLQQAWPSKCVGLQMEETNTLCFVCCADFKTKTILFIVHGSYLPISLAVKQCGKFSLDVLVSLNYE